ncbi:unnamed protein product [Bursaphelenchus okinawaensis]|uniref:Poly(A) RNA polymerase mitochondrial-like central palm domain-containing protein n=1 Tax=Bursaphelenchus okinawaensis TaxID=465554 RepID=A0A811JS19_9BILA|nr:unnamed protein product [Bursaphelenchus okinawaensis]CAG9080256.1 unnamed protein product [Bursaphelenchus okinawaensis]
MKYLYRKTGWEDSDDESLTLMPDFHSYGNQGMKEFDPNYEIKFEYDPDMELPPPVDEGEKRSDESEFSEDEPIDEDTMLQMMTDLEEERRRNNYEFDYWASRNCVTTSKSSAYYWYVKAFKAEVPHYETVRPIGEEWELLKHAVLRPSSCCIKKAGQQVQKLTKKHNRVFESINKKMVDFCKVKLLTDDRKKANEELLEVLRKKLCNQYPGWKLTPYGGSHNGFGGQCSDMDLTLHTKRNVTEKPTVTEIAKVLDTEEFRSVSKMEELKNIPNTAFPLVKMAFKRRNVMMEVDLTINNKLGVENTKLLQFYSLFDSRVAQLHTVIKSWAKHHAMHGGIHYRFNTYTLVILTINYLQKGVSPAILPHVDHVALGLRNKNEADMKEMVQGYKLELVIGFMTFYAMYDFNEWHVDITKPYLWNLFDIQAKFFRPPFDKLSVICPVGGESPTRKVSDFCYYDFRKQINAFNSLVWERLAEEKDEENFMEKFLGLLGIE